MGKCKPRATPCELKLNESCDKVSNDCPNYREIVGSLIYAMTCTRPDLCWIVTVLSQHLSDPNDDMCVAVKHVLRYLKGWPTLSYELCFQKCTDGLKLTGFSDASQGSSVDRKSVTGYCFALNQNGPLISWKSKKQATVALSSSEAEYMALAAATQESIFLTQLLCDVDRQGCHEPVCIYDDNQGAKLLLHW